ncbi:RNA polymerase recycling motor HelD [Dellaglioa sp. BT-FLS60]
MSEEEIEQQRVDSVVEEIEQQSIKTAALYEKAHKETSSVEKNYVDNAKINTFEIDDRIETNAEVQQQKQLVATTIQTEEILERQVHTLDQLGDSPYFGRIDIQDDGDPEQEQLYIGLASLVDDHQNFLIHDWRAPISSIYYNGALGHVSYETPQGKQMTELSKKRQFQIKEGQILSMFDTNETIGDELLQQVLGEQSDAQMKNIVSTIQQEQNTIIRDTTSDLLVVQGVAGSGKTSAILQRIAFLLYHSRTSLNADQIILFSPNLLFSHYISDVLPSLGEKNMRQVTLAEFFSNRFQGLKVETLFENYESNPDHQLAAIKGNERFKETIEAYLKSVSSSDLAFTDIVYEGTPFFEKKEISNIFTHLPQNMLSADKFTATKNTLTKRLKARITEMSESDWMREEIDSLSDSQYEMYLLDYERDEFDNVDNEISYIGTIILKDRFNIVYDAIYNNYFIDIYEQYAKFLETTISSEAKNTFQLNLELHKITLSDAAPLLLLRDLLTGSGQNRNIEHLFIDEIQDYSPLQLLYLKNCFPNAKLTLLGDSEQALFYDLVLPTKFLKNLNRILQIKKTNLIILNKSYRSTFEITNFAKSLLPDGNNIESFTRHGELPKIYFSKNRPTALASLITLIETSEKKAQPVAIITKNLTDCKLLYNELRSSVKLTMLVDADRNIPATTIILPIYLAKGLEFDSVVAFDISKKTYISQSDLGNLYTLCSRAMHSLSIFSIEAMSPLLENSINNSNVLIV